MAVHRPRYRWASRSAPAVPPRPAGPDRHVPWHRLLRPSGPGCRCLRTGPRSSGPGPRRARSAPVPLAPATRPPARPARSEPGPRARPGARRHGPADGVQGELHRDERPLPIHFGRCRGRSLSRPCRHGAGGRHGVAQPFRPPGPAAVQQCQEQGVLVGEVRVERPLGQPRPCADVRDGGRPEALLREQIHGRVQEGVDGGWSALRGPSWHRAILLHTDQYAIPIGIF